MLRDDIRDKVLFLLLVEYGWISGESGDLVCDECSTFEELGLSVSDVRDFVEVLMKEFELDGLRLEDVMNWVRVKDVVDTVESYLESALHDT